MAEFEGFIDWVSKFAFVNKVPTLALSVLVFAGAWLTVRKGLHDQFSGRAVSWFHRLTFFVVMSFVVIVGSLGVYYHFYINPWHGDVTRTDSPKRR